LTLSHPIDYLRWLLGDIESLWAFTGKISNLEINVDDFSEVGLKFANGVIGNLHLDYYRRPTEHRFEIIGTDGMIEWRDLTGVARIYRVANESWESCLPPEGFGRNDLFIAEMKHFIDVVEKKTEPVCSMDDGVQALRTALAIEESARLKKIIRL